MSKNLLLDWLKTKKMENSKKIKKQNLSMLEVCFNFNEIDKKIFRGNHFQIGLFRSISLRSDNGKL